jgi:hypothetical protein
MEGLEQFALLVKEMSGVKPVAHPVGLAARRECVV